MCVATRIGRPAWPACTNVSIVLAASRIGGCAPLQWRRRDVRLGVGPGGAQPGDRRVERLVSRTRCDTEAGEVRWIDAASEAALDAPAGQHVERGDLCGETEGVVQRGDEDRCAEADRGGLRGDVGEEQQRCGQHRGLGVEVLLDRPDRFEAEALGDDDLGDRLGELPPLGRGRV